MKNYFVFMSIIITVVQLQIYSQGWIHDQYFSKQWYLNMSGSESVRADIRILDAWDRTKGSSNTKIAIIEGPNDGGVAGYPDTDHDDLEYRIYADGIGISEHATNVAGLIIANHNDIGIAGVNKFAQLYAYSYDEIDAWDDKVREAVNDGNHIINISQNWNEMLDACWS